jgi:O-antigen chain-terminating methyltransferase
MFNRPLTVEDLARLKQERDDADRSYNDALTALDGEVQRMREMPHPPPSYDEHQITPLNEHWDLLQARPNSEPGWRGWVRSFIWQTVAPLFEQQQAFNSVLVDHINRNVAMHREFTAALESTIDLIREELERLIHFENRLLLYAQEITPYVDTKDRDVTRLIVEVASGVGAVSDELSKRWESMAVRERRREQQAAEQEQAAVVRELAASERELAATEREQTTAKQDAARAQAAAERDAVVEGLRASFGIVHQVTQMLKRELARLQEAEPAAATAGVDGTTSHRQRSTGDVLNQALDSYKYVEFENHFRGSTNTIRERLVAYLPYFDGATDVLDVGCGRGEFLDLLRERGVAARGIDTNHEMVQVCRERGLTAEEGDALTYLRGIPDASLGGLFAAQVVEHLEPEYLLNLLDTACLKLRPGARLILETINAASWSAFFHSYIRDITHVRPLHPDTLQYFVTASGFQDVRVEYRAPWPASSKLTPLPTPADAGPPDRPTPMAKLVLTFNHNVEKLNRLMFADQDYAVIGERR